MEEQVLIESVASVMQEFVDTVVTEATLSTLADTGRVTKDDVELIKTFAEQVVLESAEDFIPTAEMIEEAAAAININPDNVNVNNTDTGVHKEDGAEAYGDKESGLQESEEVVEESATLADRIAQKLELI